MRFLYFTLRDHIDFLYLDITNIDYSWHFTRILHVSGRPYQVMGQNAPSNPCTCAGISTGMAFTQTIFTFQETDSGLNTSTPIYKPFKWPALFNFLCQRRDIFDRIAG